MEEDRKIQMKKFIQKVFDIEIDDKHIGIYNEVLTHYNDVAPKGTREIERLAFLGDAYLEFIVRDYLFWHEDHFSIGMMTNLKQLTVSNNTWADIAEEIKLNEQIVTMQHGSRIETNIYSQKTLARSFEALAIVLYYYSDIVNIDEKIIDLFIELDYLPSGGKGQNE